MGLWSPLGTGPSSSDSIPGSVGSSGSSAPRDHYFPSTTFPPISDATSPSTFAYSDLSQHRHLARQFGLDDPQRQDDLNELAKVALACFGASILLTAVVDREVVILGQALVDGDELDWDWAVRLLTPVADLCRAEIEEEVLMYNNTEAPSDWQVSINAAGAGKPVGFYAFAPIHLPLSDDPNKPPSIALPVGGFCVVSQHPRPPGAFNKENQTLLLSLSNMVTRLLQRGHDAIQRTKEEAQATFVSEFLELALTGEDLPTIPQSKTDHVTSPAMNAVRDDNFFDTSFASRHTKIFQSAVEKITDLTPANGAMILDLRAFALSALKGKSPFEAAIHLVGDIRQLQPITVLGSHGFGDVEKKLEGQAALESIEGALRGWHDNATLQGSYRNDALAFLLPTTCQSSLVVPIIDHRNVPALLVLVSSPLASDSEMDTVDKLFVKNIGQLCLSTLLKDRAIKADRSKLAFLSQIAHELRTPIHGLGGQLELLKQMASPSDLIKFNPLLSIADICLDSLRTILDDALDFAKLSSESDKVRSTPLVTNDTVDLPVLISDIAKAAWTRKLRLSSSGSDKGGNGEESEAQVDLDVILEFAARPEGWQAQVNAPELRRIISNVVANAYTFTKDGYVRVSLEATPEPSHDGLTTVLLVVSDSGVGMSEEFLQSGQIYIPFRQADSFSPGCGLGMAIVKDLVERMNGTVVVHSTLGEGTTIEVSLPIKLLNSHIPAPEVVQVLSEALGELKQVLRQRPTLRHGWRSEASLDSTPASVLPLLSISSRPIRSPQVDTTPRTEFPLTTPPVRPALSFSGRSKTSKASLATSSLTGSTAKGPILRVFAAEDNVIARNLLAHFLKKKGYLFLAVEDGQKAVNAFKAANFRPHLTIMDIGMPNKDGVEAAFEIREHEEFMGWPRHTIIALTALASEDDKTRGLAGPFDDWLVKGGQSLRTLDATMAAMQRDLHRRSDT